MAQDKFLHEVFQHLLTLIRTTNDIDVLRTSAEWTIQHLIEADVTAKIGAAQYERTESRTNQRNGSRTRLLKTRVGELNLLIPKLRTGSYYPDWLLEGGKPAEQAILGVVMEAYANGVSTRKMERLVKEMGLQGLDKSAVSRINKGLDERVEAFRHRPLTVRYPYVWLDATFPKVREDGRVQGTALVAAIGIREDGYREILGFTLGAAETEAFWTDFLRSLMERGLNGVQLVVSDAHQGLKNAIQSVFTGVSWQRCCVHFLRNLLTQVPNSAQDEVTNWFRTILEQPTYEAAEAQLLRVVDDLERFPKAATLLEEAKEDILAHMSFPFEHWKRIRSTNPLERLNREIARRFKVVGIFPNRDAVIRLGGAVLLEQNEEWLVERKRYFGEPSMKKLLESNSLEPKKRISLGQVG